MKGANHASPFQQDKVADPVNNTHVLTLYHQPKTKSRRYLNAQIFNLNKKKVFFYISFYMFM